MSFQTLTFAIMLGFLFFGIYAVVVEDETDADLKQKLITQIQEQPTFGLIFLKALDEMSPTLTLPIGKEKFLITEFPVYSFFHLIIAIIFIFIAGFVMRVMKVGKWKQLGVFLFLIILSYFIGSIILILLYTFSGEQIGFTPEESSEFRKQYDNQFDDIITPLLVFSLFTILIILKAVFTQMRKK